MIAFEEVPAGSTVLLRVDLNTSIVDGEPSDSIRFKQAGETVRALVNKDCKVVVIAHQGRIGKKNYCSLEGHAVLLSKHVKRKVKFVPDLFGPDALGTVKRLGKKKVILLENTRFYAEELDKKIKPEESVFVKSLAGAVDCFVNDAFSVSHRSQASVIGFPKLLPSYAGPHLTEELRVLSQLNTNAKQPVVYCLGGAKLEECFDLAESAFDSGKAQNVLASGLFGEVLLLASGKELGAKRAWLEEHGYLEFVTRARCLWAKYADELILPVDFAFIGADGFRVETSDPLNASSPVFDVGTETISLFTLYLKKARTIFVKGPAGKYEEPCFELGTKELFKAVSKAIAFSVVGGGDTGAALESLGFKERDFGHVCTAGGAMLDYLTGKDLPGVSALTSS